MMTTTYTINGARGLPSTLEITFDFYCFAWLLTRKISEFYVKNGKKLQIQNVCSCCFWQLKLQEKIQFPSLLVGNQTRRFLPSRLSINSMQNFKVQFQGYYRPSSRSRNGLFSMIVGRLWSGIYSRKCTKLDWNISKGGRGG